MMIVRCAPKGRLGCASPFYGNMAARTRNPERQTQRESKSYWYPAADIYDTESDYVLKVEIPGFSKEDVNIEFKDNILSVSGERKESNKAEDKYYLAERYSGKFQRAFRLPKDVDAQKIDASMKDGVLELKVAKPEEKKPRNIPITVY